MAPFPGKGTSVNASLRKLSVVFRTLVSCSDEGNSEGLVEEVVATQTEESPED
jgi:hypothetical protein